MCVQVRQTAAAALGSLVKSMDDSQYAELEKYLLFTMKSDASMVERAGAAQGLGEVRCLFRARCLIKEGWSRRANTRT